MIRVLSKWWAKKQYVWRQLVEAATNDLNAGLALRTAGEKRAPISQLSKDADAIEANIKAVDVKLTAGYWECENGHETDANSGNTAVDSSGQVPLCDCGAPKKLIKCDQMNSQEKYESDKERKEAQDIADNIADLSFHSPNVYYELCLRHTTRLPRSS
jgi:hypothetical protein